MPRRRTRTHELLSLDPEELRILGRIIGQSIAEELLKHMGDVRAPFFAGAEKINIPITIPGNMPQLDASVMDVGASTEGIEAKFDDIAESDVQKDSGLASSRAKLSKLKQK